MKPSNRDKALLFLMGMTCPAIVLYRFLHPLIPDEENREKSGRKPGEKEKKP